MDFFSKVRTWITYCIFSLLRPTNILHREWIEQFGSSRFYVRRGTSDVFVLIEVFRWHSYGRTPPRGIVFDVGANIGAFTLFAAQTADKVYAFEPESSNFAQLTKNMQLNGVQNVVPRQEALGAAHGVAQLHVVEVNKGRSSVINTVSGTIEEVPVVTCDEVLIRDSITHIDFLKMDIEGGEYDAFLGISDRALTAVREIQMEIHRVTGRNSSEIIDRLVRLGFAVQIKKNRFSPDETAIIYAKKATP